MRQRGRSRAWHDVRREAHATSGAALPEEEAHPMKPVRYERAGDVALVAVDNPPVNAASHAVRAGLVAALERAAEEGVRAVGLYGEGRTFIAGADIREFGRPPADPWLPGVCDAIENSPVPVACTIHGTALGGGLEVAMAAHARVALPSARMGLPEVTLGIIPGAGGTQRMPRLAGVARALDLILSARQASAKEALEAGLIDWIEDGAPRDVALRAARAVAEGKIGWRRTGDLPAERDDAAVAEAIGRLERRSPQLFAPRRAAEAVGSSHLPLEEGLRRERALFEECLDHPQRAALIHAFFAERAVAKIPEAGATPRAVGAVGVLGGGTMGSGIATAALLAGLRTVLVERDAEALARARATVEGNLAGAVERGKLSEGRRAEALEAFRGETDMAALSEADLVVEAVFEDMDLKREVFARLDAVARPGAVLATNTSYLDVDAIAAATARPGDVLGLHFFSPAHVMRLLEVVVGERTAPEAVATGFALARRMRKVAVRAGVCDGFIGNRILAHYRKAVDHLVLDGAAPEQVDAALEAWGFALGPFAVSDLAGLDIGWATRKRLAPTRPPEERYSAVADRICEMGRFGRKSGRGFYLYEDGRRRPDPEVAAIVAAERERHGIAPREVEDGEIVDRVLTAMAAEGARVLEEGIALRPSDIDVTFLAGYGFPRFRGGPMFQADRTGAAELVARIERWAADDPQYWRVPGLLGRMAREGGSFAAMNADGR
jgi:3-hydroxyacyl-CoA dehydrogenase